MFKFLVLSVIVWYGFRVLRNMGRAIRINGEPPRMQQERPKVFFGQNMQAFTNVNRPSSREPEIEDAQWTEVKD